jgi:PAS domain S-box-containing protein
MKKILVVDNDPVLLRLLTHFLEKKGHQVLTAEDGLSALDILESYVPEVIFIDLVMPHISGDKLCRIIRSMPRMKNVYLIILSGIAAEQATDFAEFGANTCIVKGPFNKIAKHVDAVLDQSGLVTSSDLSKKIIGLEGIYQRQTIKELLSSKRHSEAILNNMTEGILELTLEGRIFHANPSAISLTGIPEEKLLASDFTQLFHENHRARIKGLLKVTGDTPQTITEEPPVILNGKQISLTIVPVKDEDHESIVVILNDITERIQMEEASRKVAALETANVVIENFVSDALGNLLSPIYGRIQLCGIRDNIGQIKSEIEVIEGGIAKLLTGINAYREFCRLGEHSIEKISSTDISYILAPLLSGQSLKTYGNEKFPIDPGVKLRFVYGPKQEGALDWEGLPYVAGDESKIATAIQETLINAIESYDQGKGGDILVSAKKENNDLILEVADKGRGMSKEERDKSQLPFFKVLGVKGSDRFGLGAYIARESAKYCGGDIHIESTKGVGTTASIILEVSD